MHWSERRAKEVLWVLRQHDGSATTWQIAAFIKSACVHSNVSSLRSYLEDNGYSRDAVECRYQGTNDRGRRIYRYHLAPGVMRGDLEDERPAALDGSQATVV